MRRVDRRLAFVFVMVVQASIADAKPSDPRAISCSAGIPSSGEPHWNDGDFAADTVSSDQLFQRANATAHFANGTNLFIQTTRYALYWGISGVMNNCVEPWHSTTTFIPIPLKKGELPRATINFRYWDGSDEAPDLGAPADCEPGVEQSVARACSCRAGTVWRATRGLLGQCACINEGRWNAEKRACEPSCPAKMRYVGDGAGGRCECEPGTNWDATARHCVSCEEGLVWSAARHQCACPGNLMLVGSGNSAHCQCRAGFQWNAGARTCECPEGLVPSTDGTRCEKSPCPPGMRLNAQDKRCECNTGTNWSRIERRCIGCDGGRKWNGTACACPAGLDWTGSSCTCSGGMIATSAGCRCPTDAPNLVNGRCVAAPAPATCGYNSNSVAPQWAVVGTLGPDGSCICPSGRAYSNYHKTCCKLGSSDCCSGYLYVFTTDPRECVPR
jgi:hypothetical protein